MKKLLQIDPNYVPTTSQAIASAARGALKTVFEMRPEYVDGPTLKLFNRATGQWVQTTSTAKIGKADWVPTTKGSGYIYTNDGRDSHSYPMPMTQGKELTFIAVAKQNPDSITFMLHQSSSDADVDTAIAPSLIITTAGLLKVYEGRTTRPERLAATVPDPTALHIYTMTFSTAEGLKLYVDGALLASNTTDKRQYTKLEASLTAVGRSAYGHAMLIGEDLSKPENQAKMRLVHDALKAHYAIS